MPLITLNANFNVENAQKSTKKSEKKNKLAKNTILSFIDLKTVQTNPLAFLLVLRLYVPSSFCL